MLHCCYVYYISKFTEFFDTVSHFSNFFAVPYLWNTSKLFEHLLNNVIRS